MSDAPREHGITEKARKGKKKVRASQSVAAEPAIGPTRPNRSTEPLDESGSPQAATPVADSSAGVSWPVFPPSHEQHRGSPAELAASGLTGRPFLQREGTNGFKPNLPATSMITVIIRNRLVAFYPTWGTVPEKIRRDWFNEWRMLVDWDPVDEDHMWGAFNYKGNCCYRDMMTDIRKAKKRPHWMGEEFYGELLRHSESATFLRMSKANKENSMSPVGGSLYAGGSVSTGTHRDRLGKELGRDPTIIEEYRRTRFSTKKNKWVEPRAEAVQEVVSEKLREFASSQDSTAGSTAQPPPDKMFEIWKEAAGGRKKGRIYGFGFIPEFFFPQPPRENIGSSRAWEAEIEEMRTQVNLLSSNVGSQVDRISSNIESRMNQRLDQRLEQIESKLDQFMDRFSRMAQYPLAPQQQSQNVNAGDDGGSDGDGEDDDAEEVSESGSEAS